MDTFPAAVKESLSQPRNINLLIPVAFFYPLPPLTEIRNLTHSMSKELAEVRRDHDRLQEVLSRVQEELRNITGKGARMSFYTSVRLHFDSLMQACPIILLLTEVICTKCPPGWQHFEKNCYFFSTSTKSWLDAKQFCTNEGSHLVIVNTKQEQTFLSNQLIEPDVYWLGLSDSAKEGEWRWVDGSLLSLRQVPLCLASLEKELSLTISCFALSPVLLKSQTEH
uniref:C-type lectin domain-containing protein n=1 Tax=Chrysemys picta bellii TaxID=8478 RepID=A0A8C3P8R2_CHRPI